jgi:hypothetical protein
MRDTSEGPRINVLASCVYLIQNHQTTKLPCTREFAWEVNPKQSGLTKQRKVAKWHGLQRPLSILGNWA